jgi:putative membrane protein
MKPSPVKTVAARVAFCLGWGMAALALSTVAPAADTPATLSTHQQAFVAKATADNSMQITLAQVALDRSQSPKVRALARRIIDDHNALNEKFTDFSVAKKAHGQAHGTPSQDVTADKLHLQNLQGDALDKAFAGMMVKEHQKIIPLYERVAKDDSNSSLQKIARGALPLLREHLQAARALGGM